jgi:hypothetical protein
MNKYQEQIENAVAAAVISASTLPDGNIHLRADRAVLALMGVAGELLVLSGAAKTEAEVIAWVENFASHFHRRLVKAQKAQKNMPANVVVSPPKNRAH